MNELDPVNQRVAGSSPAGGAISSLSGLGFTGPNLKSRIQPEMPCPPLLILVHFLRYPV